MFFKKQPKESKKGTWSDGIGSLFLAVLVALSIRWLLLEAYVIPSGSMLPSLLINDHIFVNKIIYGVRVPFQKTWLAKFREPTRGEVIVFRFPENESIFFIKRVIGVPGDKIYYDNGDLYINDQLIETKPAESPKAFNYLRDDDFRSPGNYSDRKENYAHLTEYLFDTPHSILLRKSSYHLGVSPLVVPEGSLFVMGDNRDNSNDSRGWGFVPMENVLGRAMFVWLSCEETLPVVSFLCNPFTVRGTRFFHSIK